ncbi:hypothetical protein MD588_10300 [Photobacterium sp. SDRW27]|uniref:hypothetical protein n=1 Tax=Photobacterium obscurum TaxID=2829490 RepID=UPI0022430DCC|nr:hypothetical protein [Photobacterium obscurum]MCW8329197.1 hypothetical protein [Photobacterium obscurum]
MKLKSIAALSVLVALAGCGATEDDAQSISGWGTGGSYDTDDLKRDMKQYATLVAKNPQVDNGLYTDKRGHMSTPYCVGQPAFDSEWFEVSRESGVSDDEMLYVTQLYEVALGQIAQALNVTKAEILTNAYRNKLGICIRNTKGSMASGHGSESVTVKKHNHGSDKFFHLIKHEITHLVNSQYNNNQVNLSILPGWYNEGIAEFAVGSRPLSAKEWNKQATEMESRSMNNNILDGGDSSFDDYDVFATIATYLDEQGWGHGAMTEFIKKDHWHMDDAPHTDGHDHMVLSNTPEQAYALFKEDFDNQSAESQGEVTSYDQFRSNYKDLIYQWLKNR